MWSYFLKDIREQFKWACLVLVVYIGAFIVHNLSDPHAPVCRVIEDSVVIPCVAGLLMGVVLALSENLGNRWAFMAHRPVTLQQIFWGKSLAGVVLLAGSLGLPLLGELLFERFRTPRFPVFYWAMALGTIPDFLAAVAFMFCGMASVLREARWFGGKIFPVSLAFCAICLSLSAFTFQQSLLMSGIFLVFSILAARAVFLSAGQTPHRGSAGKFAVALGLFISITAIYFAAWALYTHLVPQVFSFPYSAMSISLDDEGIPIVHTRRLQLGIKEETYHSLSDGSQLDAEKINQLNKSANARMYLNNIPARDEYGLIRYRFDSDFYIDLGRSTSQNVRYAYSRREKIFLLYSSSTLKSIGTLGADGFVLLDKGRAKPLDIEMIGEFWNYNPVLTMDQAVLASQQSLFEVDFVQGTFRKTFSIGADEIITGLLSQDRFYGNDPQYFTGGFILATNKKIYWIDRQYQVQHEENAQNSTHYLNYSKTAGMWRLQKEPRENKPGVAADLSVTSISSDFKTSHTRVYSTPPYPDNDPSLLLNLLYPIGHEYSAIASPMFIYALERILIFLMAPHLSVGSYNMLSNIPASIWTYSLIGMALSSLLTWTLLAPRLALSKTHRVAWTLLNFLLGWIGIVVMLCLLEKPTFLPCPHCNKKRPVNKPLCPHCAADWPAPKPDQTEIFIDPVAINA